MVSVSEQPIVLLSELRSNGASYREAHRAVARLTRLTRGAYADLAGHGPEEQHVLRARALVQRVSGVVASHTTAGAAWALPVPRAALRSVQLSPRAGRVGHSKSGPGYHLHYRPVAGAEADETAGLQVTSPLRTLLDCATRVSLDWAVAIADTALRRGLVDFDALGAQARRTRRIHGAAKVRALPNLCSTLSESPGESLLRVRLVRMGLPFVEQATINAAGGPPRVDFLIEERLVVEFDGQEKYSLNGDPAAAHWAEKLRHDGIVEAGFEVLHVAWNDLWDEHALRARIARALDRAHSRSCGAGRTSRWS